jgi:hypothetical protein
MWIDPEKIAETTGINFRPCKERRGFADNTDGAGGMEG